MRFNEYKKDERMNMVLWTVLLLIVVVACMFSKRKKREDVSSNKKNATGDIVRTWVKQSLETIHVMETTINIDVLVGRMDLLSHLKTSLAEIDKTYLYNSAVNDGIEFYKNMYYNRDVTKVQLDFITSPATFNDEPFIACNIYRCFSQYCQKMKNEMETLKTNSAKEKRRDKIIDVSHTCINELSHIGKLENYIHNIIDMLNEVGITASVRPKENQPASNSSYVFSLKPLVVDSLMKYASENCNITNKKEALNVRNEIETMLDNNTSPDAPFVDFIKNDTRQNYVDSFRLFIDSFFHLTNHDDNGYFRVSHFLKPFTQSYVTLKEIQETRKADYNQIKRASMVEIRKYMKFRMPSLLKGIIEDPLSNEKSIKEISLSAFIEGTEYWDDVLSSYKQKKAYANRLEYLLDKLSEIEKNEIDITELNVLIMNHIECYSDLFNSVDNKKLPAETPGAKLNKKN